MNNDRIGIIGAGNVGYWLAKKLAEENFIVFIASRSRQKVNEIKNEGIKIHEFSLDNIPENLSTIFLCVQDKAIEEVSFLVSSRLKDKENVVVVHLSGATPISVFEKHFKHYGCLYPLNSFRRERKPQWERTPIFIEGNNSISLSKIKNIAECLSKNIEVMDSETRAKLHTIAVFLSNFPNFIYCLAEELCRDWNIKFSHFFPLMEETLLRLQYHSPWEMQTGPALRHDIPTISKHLQLLNSHKTHKRIYHELTLSIMEKFKNNSTCDFAGINVIVFDIDGVLTDGKIMPTDQGEFIRNMDIKDGYALQLAVKQNTKIVILSGSHAHAFVRRFSYLGISHIYLGIENKLDFFSRLLKKEGWNWNEIACMGDDIPDIPLMKCAGLPCAPCDAVPEVKALAKYISPFPGGHGAARDLIEKILKAKNQWIFLTDSIKQNFFW